MAYLVRFFIRFSFCTGLVERQFVQFNGGFSQEQLDWLDEVLTYADKNQERVVIMGKTFSFFTF